MRESTHVADFIGIRLGKIGQMVVEIAETLLLNDGGVGEGGLLLVNDLGLDCRHEEQTGRRREGVRR